MYTQSLRNLAAAFVVVFGVAHAPESIAASRAELNKRVTATVSEFRALKPANAALINKASGVLVFPRITKAGVGVGAEYGEGALQIGGKTVSHYRISSASVGLTLGVAQHSEILMFMTPASLKKFRESQNWSIGADAGVTVVRESVNGEYDSLIENKPILAFGFAEKGLIGDLSLEGSKITKSKN